ncbi:hypothetical protein DDB_G0291778 [Dictyostelium discoideum AX4]|uniref:Uncharacterized protein n=1 Tax=Dictyostelium discoideum TaxID=44689 RepID=Q54E74_DICDI|nr:hypothetical protein DDB_G0291778 [Dictyostelium discoideum AX4]EAL61585.1 hypothetical protein DDB_G0291778 [Dictyostelium discoideum AX4]|eukprot:XP_629988.1 hypothetical protein DDB_G0291778 [Dictyostelium discoideum AX4]
MIVLKVVGKMEHKIKQEYIFYQKKRKFDMEQNERVVDKEKLKKAIISLHLSDETLAEQGFNNGLLFYEKLCMAVHEQFNMI